MRIRLTTPRRLVRDMASVGRQPLGGVGDSAPLEANLLKEAGQVEATCQLKLHSFGTGAPAGDKLQLE